MAVKPIVKLTAVVLTAAFVLSGCQSDEDRVAEYFASGQSYVEAGDFPRAVIQFRNALRLDSDHAPTRAAMARALLDHGDLHGARQEYAALSERYPTEVAWRKALGDIALVRSDWTALERYAEEAQRIGPDDADTRTLQLAVAYRRAASEQDRPRRDLIAHEAQKALISAPTDGILLRIVVEHLASSDEPENAVPFLDKALAENPHVPELQILRIRLLSEAGQIDAAEDRLLGLAELYPQDVEIASILASRYLTKGDIASAEQVLRSLADGAPRVDTSLRITLVRFLQRVHGDGAALAELSRLTDVADGTPAGALYSAMARSIRFDAGETEGAVADIEDILSGIESTAEGLQMRVLKARFEDRLGNRDKAVQEVASVLAVDPGNLSALKLRGEWLIEVEQPKPAIVALRSAVSQAPRDTEVMNLLAAAHELDGNQGLAMEQLATASEISGHAARESERYALALLDSGRPKVAQRVLEAARLRDPGDVRLITTLAAIYVRGQNWVRARALLGDLEELDTPEARDARAPLQAAILEGEGDRAAALSLLDDLVGNATDDHRAAVLVLQSLLRRNELAVARAYLDHALAVDPDAVALNLLDATLRQQEGDLPGAEAILRRYADAGHSDLTLRKLFLVLKAQDRLAEAEEVLARGLEMFPNSRSLLLIESDRLNAQGDATGAIAILDDLYRENPTDRLVANNLASLISVHADDAAELDRAARIAATLRAESVPAVADTVGWIAFRRGDAERALPLMERASRGLPYDLGVQLRLGQVYAAVGRIPEARDVLGHVAGADHPLAEDAKRHLAGLPGPQ